MSRFGYGRAGTALKSLGLAVGMVVAATLPQLTATGCAPGGSLRDRDADGFERGEDCMDCISTREVNGRRVRCDEVFPGAAEQCDAFDNDCDGTIDEDATSTNDSERFDNDGDGVDGPPQAFCNPARVPQAGNCLSGLTLSGFSCSGSVRLREDCDDEDPEVSPQLDEVCEDGKDNDCDGDVDEEGGLFGGGCVDDDDVEDDDDLVDDGVPYDEIGGLLFSARFVISAPGDDDDSAGDDDDSAGDDDDSAGDDDDSAGDDDDAAGGYDVSAVSMELTASYVQSDVYGSLICRQSLLVTGELRAGPVADCALCAARLQFDPSTAVVVPPPTPDPVCDPAELADHVGDYGLSVLTPPPVGYGDLLDLALLSAEAHDSSGLDLAVDDTPWTAESAAAQAQSLGHEAVGPLLVRAVPSSLTGSVGLEGVSAVVEGDWRGLGDLTVPSGSAAAAPPLVGEYFWAARWGITLP